MRDSTLSHGGTRTHLYLVCIYTPVVLVELGATQHIRLGSRRACVLRLRCCVDRCGHVGSRRHRGHAWLCAELDLVWPIGFALTLHTHGVGNHFSRRFDRDGGADEYEGARHRLPGVLALL